ncbi:unnamed protein product [Moneuplotes crassus]|uniref:Uncharacterized protein n=1 Tax=Euplotes crassus TaxID=5936 RepID=A0AAD1X407_EUPCR|nr:unnamed protein product [Moneuplotes crassus]
MQIGISVQVRNRKDVRARGQKSKDVGEGEKISGLITPIVLPHKPPLKSICRMQNNGKYYNKSKKSKTTKNLNLTENVSLCSKNDYSSCSKKDEDIAEMNYGNVFPESSSSDFITNIVSSPESQSNLSRPKIVKPLKINIKLPKIDRRLNNSLRYTQNEYEEAKKSEGDLDSQSSLTTRRIVANPQGTAEMHGKSFDMTKKMMKKYSMILSSSQNQTTKRSEAKTELRDPKYSIRHQPSQPPLDLLWGEARGKKSLGIRNIEIFKNTDNSSSP